MTIVTVCSFEYMDSASNSIIFSITVGVSGVFIFFYSFWCFPEGMTLIWVAFIIQAIVLFVVAVVPLDGSPSFTFVAYSVIEKLLELGLMRHIVSSGYYLKLHRQHQQLAADHSSEMSPLPHNEVPENEDIVNQLSVGIPSHSKSIPSVNYSSNSSTRASHRLLYLLEGPSIFVSDRISGSSKEFPRLISSWVSSKNS
jgi:hypothetical protein